MDEDDLEYTNLWEFPNLAELVANFICRYVDIKMIRRLFNALHQEHQIIELIHNIH